MIKVDQMWYLLLICHDFATVVIPFFRPVIDWNNEDHVSSLTALKLRLYLKQQLQVSGGKATLVATLRSGCSTNSGTRRQWRN